MIFIPLAEGAASELLNRIGVLEAGELIVAPEGAVHLRVALHLHHLDQWLEMGPRVRVAGGGELGEHPPLAGDGVVGDRQQPHALAFQARHPAPEFFFVVEVEGAHHRGRHPGGAEEHVVVQIGAAEQASKNLGELAGHSFQFRLS
jgi:hypothetical protein